MRLRRAELLPLAVIAVTTLAGALGWLPILVVVPVVLTLPGYLILSALGAEGTFTDVELVAVSVATTMAVLILGAQLLNLLPFGISTPGWIVLVGSLAVLATAVILRRRPLAPRGAPRELAARPIPALSRTTIALLVMAIVATVFALVVSTAAVAVRTDPGFTQLWLDAVGTDQVRVSVRSQELRPTSYRLKLSTEREPRSLTLQPDQLWTIVVDRGNASEFRSVLYLDGQQTAYRQAWLSR